MKQKEVQMCVKNLWAIQRGLLPVLVCVGLLMRGVVAQQVQIDETKPGNIPAQIISDWEAQDGTNYDQATSKIKSSLPQEYASKITGSGKEGYYNACHWRRVYRMKPYARELKRLIYARHHDIGGAIIGYTEDLNSDGAKGVGPWGMTMGKSSDYNNGNKNGTAIHLLEFDNYYSSPKTILEDKKGCVRDPCPNYKGDKIVFAWSKDNNGYALYEVEIATGKTRQITDNNPSGIRVSDMEPCVLPNEDIVFMSSRCFQHVDCNVNLVSNLYICDKDGKYLRRIGYDQVNVFYPTMRENGSIMYTRWEYNDRNVANVFGIFTMNIDGTGQTEYFGNQTEFPATFNQAREIPGTGGAKALATIGGHMGPYAGDLVMIDTRIARNVVSGKQPVKLIAPPRTLNSGGGFADMNGVPDENKLFQNPYPLDEEWFLISYRKTRNSRFGIYLMNVQGERELLAWADGQSVSQPVSLAEKPIPPKLSYMADYAHPESTWTSVMNVYYGDGVKGIEKGTIKKIRVVAMEYRVHPAYGNTGSSAYQMTPVGRYGASWEAKWIVGEAPVAEDGSASFFVPPNTPIFLQLIDDKGVCVQTMRSWMTLMPGEKAVCAGCHEDKNVATPTVNPVKVNPEPLKPLYDIGQEPGSFYFPKVVQPILDQYCVKSGCHDKSHKSLVLDGTEKVWTGDLDRDQKDAYRYWLRSYWNLCQNKYSHCDAIMGRASALPIKSVGSPKSAVVKKLLGGHNNVPQKAIDIICAWIDLGIPHSGTYTDDMKEEHKKGYLERVALRKKLEDIEKKNIEQFIADGGYKQPKYQIGTGVETPKEDLKKISTAGTFKAEFLVTEKMLSLKVPSEGSIKILDLAGRQILSKEITKDAFLKSAEHKIKLKDISAGSYIVKFDGVKVSGEQLISIL